VWLQNILNIRDGVGEVDTGWLTDNITRQVGDGESTLFWYDSWIEGKSLCELYVRLFELADNKLDMVAAMFAKGWGVNGEAWKWRCRLFAWEDELLEECIIFLSNFSFRLTVLINGFGSYMLLIVTLLVLLIVF